MVIINYIIIKYLRAIINAIIIKYLFITLMMKKFIGASIIIILKEIAHFVVIIKEIKFIIVILKGTKHVIIIVVEDFK